MFMIDPYRFVEPTYPGAGVITYVGGASDNYVTTPAALDLTALTGGIGSAPETDDVIVVTVATADVANTPDDPALVTSGFTALTAVLSQADINRGKQRSWYQRVGTTPITSILAATLASDQSGCIAVKVLRGIHSDITDVAAQTDGGTNDSQSNPPSITPSTAGAWIMAIATGAGGANFTAISGMTDPVTAVEGASVDHCGCSIIMADYDGWASGAYDPATATGGGISGNDCWNAATLAFKPSDVLTPPTFSANPSITSANGFYGNGDTLTGVPGTHNGITTGYQWKRNGVAIGGETGLSYTLTGTDLTKYITFCETAINYLGETEATSSAIGPVADPTYSNDTRIPAGDMQSGSDRRIPAGDMQSGSDVRKSQERV